MSKTTLHRAGDVAASPSFPKIEEEILRTGKKTTRSRSPSSNALVDRGSNEFVFYDGPPFANDLLRAPANRLCERHRRTLPDDEGHRVERRFG